MHILLDGDEERLAILFINASEWVLFDFFCNTLLIFDPTRREMKRAPYFIQNIRWLWCLTPLSIIFQLYRAVSFIDGGNRSIRINPPTCHMSLTNFIT